MAVDQSRLTECSIWVCDAQSDLNLDVDSVRSEIEARGALGAIRFALAREDSQLLDVVASGRPDLSFEAFALRPAWRSLFSKSEISTAETRLHEWRKTFEHDQHNGIISNLSVILWIEDMPVKAGGGFGLSTSPNVCKQLSESSQSLDEVGSVYGNLGSRLHLKSCADCLTKCKNLIQVFDAWNVVEFSKLRELLRALSTCIQSPRGINTAAHLDREAVAWTAIVLAVGLADGLLHEDVPQWVAARNSKVSDSLTRFVQTLNRNEFMALQLIQHISSVFEGLLPDNNCTIAEPRGMRLPQWCGSPAIPGVFTTTECTTWEQTMDLLGSPPEFPSGDGPEEFFCSGFLQLALLAAAREGDLDHGGIAVSTQVSRRPIGIRRLEDESEEILNTIPQRSRAHARSSLEQVLGAHVFASLSPEARSSAICSEQLLNFDVLDDFDMAVAKLAKAFELQLRYAVFEPFCDELIERGVRRFPEYNQPLSGKLINHGMFQRKVSNDNLREFIERPAPELKQFLELRNLVGTRILDAIKAVQSIRNVSTHEIGFPQERARGIRDRWLSPDRHEGGIFGALLPCNEGRPNP